MSETTDRPMTVKAARKLLSDTRRASPEQVREAETLIRELQLKRPGLNFGRDGGVGVATCLSCGCAAWSLHVDGDDEVWGCDRCHRPPLSVEEAKALRAAKAEQERRLAAAEAAEIAARPTPRAALAAAAKELTEARDEEGRLALAGEKARDALVGARAALDAAEQALLVARQRVAEDNVTALLSGGKKPQRGVAAETAALEVARNGLELATTAAATIEDMLADARYQMPRLEKRHHEAALTVLSDETAPLFVARAAESVFPHPAFMNGFSRSEERGSVKQPAVAGGGRGGALIAYWERGAMELASIAGKLEHWQ